ncbi:programmed cell death protein 5 [Cyclospora cayetanensis]|uniref:Double-stranded DNA-binding domain-containing protein n=2 Tax=Cyclospora cayetanensis TaxID=88456 RepID=A0A1D3D430_9EIME|nr:programmed cell death protein 5 [Cyclospora cayetanensis]OEH78181.1 double-stranded DNA-binding domain-containing protein [Cyclospora cayetanensis]
MDPETVPTQKQLQQQMQQEEKCKAIEEQRRMAMRSLLSSEAHQRLSRISMVKPQNAAAAENFILQAARSGALQPPVSESTLIEILERISGAENKASNANPKVVIRRRRFDDDDSDEDI